MELHPVLCCSSKLDSNKRMFTAVYRRLKSSRSRSSKPEGYIGNMEASTSNAGRHNLDEEIGVPPEGTRRARSIRLRSNQNISGSNFKFKEPQDHSEDNNSIDVDKVSSPSRGEQKDLEDLEDLECSGESCCKMALKFTDPSSDVEGKSFKRTLPEVTEFPDFLVERSRYDASVARNWTARDKCQVWWKNEGEADGSWWEGRILSVKPKSVEFPDSPRERYVVKYKSDPTETHHHSLWELYDTGTHWEQPRIDDDSRDKLIHALTKLEQSGYKPQDYYYGINKLRQVSQKTSFINRNLSCPSQG